MRISRIFQHCSLIVGETITLDEDASHYLSRVMRCKPGYICQIFDGKGLEARVEIIEIGRTNISVKVLELMNGCAESPINIHLAQALCKGDKMDWLLQKSIELGVTEVTPLITERCDVKLSNDRLQKKWLHWRKIMISATEQSGRSYLAILNPACYFRDFNKEDAIFLSPHASSTISSLAQQNKKNICIMVGPEGGFSLDEENLAISQGAKSIKLGQRILRTETAALATIATLQTLFGDYQ